jgi:CheY-like chemotaxis protein
MLNALSDLRPKEETMATNTTGGRRYRILVTDDDDAVRALVAVLLRKSDVEVRCARDGSDALGQLRAGPRPDLLLLDLCMPRLDGWQVLAALRADEGLRTLPVVVLTSLGTVEDLPHGVPVLHKPIDPDVLCTMIDAFVDPLDEAVTAVSTPEARRRLRPSRLSP